MAYTKQTWTNDVTAITAERMTHIENGIYDNSLATDKINPSGTATTSTEIEEGQISDVIGFKSLKLKGQTSQGENPTPDNPQDVNNVSGDNVITISNVNLSEKWETGDINAYTGIESANTSVLRNTNYIHYDTSLTYRLSVNGAKPNNSVSLRFYNKNKEYIGYAQLNINGGSNFSITVSTSVSDTTPKYFRIRMATTVATLSDNIMVTTKSDLSYIAHQGNNFDIDLPIELCKIGAYADYIYKKDGKWFKHKEIGKVTWNGTENWQNNAGISTTYVISRPTDLAQANNNVFYNYFSTVEDLSVATEGARIGSSINLKNPNTTDLASFKTWLSTHNTTMYYQSTTPIEEEITYAPLLRQLDELYNSGLYDVTNISQDNSSEAFVLDLEACKNNINGIVEYIRR